MKKFMLLLVLVLCMAMLTGCFCKHETWKDATCETPKTCAECGETDGKELGHIWLAATCEIPRTCEQCGVTIGEAKGHTWQDATCETPKTCSICSLTEGRAFGHDWQDATTDAPKTCSACALTEGERIITDPRFTTAATIELQGKWGLDIPMTAEDLGIPVQIEPLAFVIVLEFGNDGSQNTYFTVADEEAFIDTFINFYIEALYAGGAERGMDKEAADQFFLETYGMSVEECAKSAIADFSIDEIIEEFLGASSVQGVYYVENGKLYTGYTWESDMDEDTFTVDGDSLTIPSFNEGLGMEGSFYRIHD